MIWNQNFQSVFYFLKNDKRITYTEPSKDYLYRSFSWKSKDNEAIIKTFKEKYLDAWQELQWDYYNPHEQMAEALEDLYNEGKLSYHNPTSNKKGYLTRTEGSCHFCVNKHWSFPEGCPYKKNEEEPPPPGFLNAVVTEIIKHGKPISKEK